MVNRASSPALRAFSRGLVCLLATFACAATAYATPPDTLGYGSRSTSLGGAVTASVEDASAVYYNPAGLARAGALRLQVGYFSQSPFLSINGQQSDVERQGGVSFGLVAPATFGDFRIAFGLGLQLPDQRVARTRSAIVDRPRWELYDTRSHRLYLSTHLAIRPVSWLTIGGGLVFQSGSVLTLDIRGDLPFTNAEDDARLEHQFKGDLRSVRYGSLGVQAQVHERVSIGLVYRSEVQLGNTIVALADASVGTPGTPGVPLTLSLISESTSLFGPQQVSFGIDFQPLDRLNIALELSWNDWSAHPSLIANQTVDLELGGTAAFGDIESLPQLPMDLHDTFVPRIGIEYAALEGDVDFDIRAGYVYENSPFPAQAGITNFVDNDKHTISLGLGVSLNDLRPTLPGALQFNAHFAYAALRARDHNKASLVDPVGDYRSTGYLLAAGVDISLVFE